MWERNDSLRGAIESDGSGLVEAVNVVQNDYRFRHRGSKIDEGW